MNEDKKQIVRFAKVIQVDTNGKPIENNTPVVNKVVVVQKDKKNPINILLITGIILIIIALILFGIFYVLPRI